MYKCFHKLKLTSIWVMLLIVCSFLTGCLPSRNNLTQFYILTPASGNEQPLQTSTKKLSVEITDLRLPQYLDRPQIVTRSTANRIELAEFHQWGGNLRKNLARAMFLNLSKLLNTPDITIAPNHPKKVPDYQVEVEVMQFERGADNLISLSAQWRLIRGEDEKILMTEMTQIYSQEGVTVKDIPQTVSSMSALWGDLNKTIAVAILQKE